MTYHADTAAEGQTTPVGVEADFGSVYDGVLRKSLEAHCRRCGEAALGLPGWHQAAMSELREDLGWGTRGGKWVCRRCLTLVPRGHRWKLP